MNEYLLLSEEDQEKCIEILKKVYVSKRVEVAGKKYLLAHTVPDIDELPDYKKWTATDFLMGEPDYEKVYFEDITIVTGHTPTGFIDPKSRGKIWKGNNHIAIDCGAVFIGTLGCLCLDTMEEFYV